MKKWLSKEIQILRYSSDHLHTFVTKDHEGYKERGYSAVSWASRSIWSCPVTTGLMIEHHPFQ